MTTRDRDKRMQEMQAARHRATGEEERADAAASPSGGDAAPQHRSGFVLETEAWNEIFAATQAALQSGGTPVLIEGEAGAGKSVFLARLAASVSSSCVLELRHPFGEAGLLARLSQAFGAEPGALDRAIARRMDEPVLIAVDDAHHLSPFALRALLGLQQTVRREGGRLGLVLTTRPGEVQRRIALLPSFAPFRGDVLTTIPMPALNEGEAEEYLRLAMEGAGRPPFDSQQVRSLHRLARGLPGQLDRVAADLLRGVRPQPWRKRERANRRRLLPTEWWMPAAIGAAAVVVIFLGYRVLFVPSNEPLSVMIAPAEPVASEATAEPSLSAASGEGEAALSPERPVGAAETPVAPPPQAPVAAAPAPAAPSSQTASQAARPAAPQATNAPVDDRTWLLAQDPRRYTIQLASAPDAEGAKRFIDRNGPQGRTVAIETLRGSFIVLHGSYGSHAEAQRAIAALPATLRRNDPFARRIESVRELMGSS